jgi:thiamine-phosphate pyrophosphorylase
VWSFDPWLCLVTDRSFRPEAEFLSTIEAAIDAGVTWVQFREKAGLTDRAAWKLAAQVRELTLRKNVPLIIDDRLDLAMAVDADGVHLGQTDLPLAAVRGQWKAGKLWGVSVFTPEQTQAARREGADYVGVGALFPTDTKVDALPVPPLGLPGLTAVGLPVIGIGGITPERTADLRRRGCAGVAVVSAVWGARDPAAAVTAFVRAWAEGRP